MVYFFVRFIIISFICLQEMTAYKKGPLALVQPPQHQEVDDVVDFDGDEEYKWSVSE